MKHDFLNKIIIFQHIIVSKKKKKPSCLMAAMTALAGGPVPVLLLYRWPMEIMYLYHFQLHFFNEINLFDLI